MSLQMLFQQSRMYAALVKLFYDILWVFFFFFFVHLGIGTGVPVPDLPLWLQNILSQDV